MARTSTKKDRPELPAAARTAPPPTLPVRDPCCIGPCDPPWRDDEQCSVWYETRFFHAPLTRDRKDQTDRAVREYIEFRITYEHRLCRLGKQLGPLLYTVTLLPGEKVTLYQSERFAQITSVEDRFSVETTFTGFLSRIHETNLTSNLDLLGTKFSDLNKETASVGGLVGLLGLPKTAAKGGAVVNDHAALNAHLVSDQFYQSVIQASRLTHTERSVVVSTYAESEAQKVTSRTFQNDNACRAVTYFVRKVLELFSVSTVVSDISYRIISPQFPPDWHPIADVGWLPPAVQGQIKTIAHSLPRVGTLVERPKAITLPTDGTVYDPELAHCGSCEPEREVAIELQLKKQQAEVQLLELELERRRMLLQQGDLAPFEAACQPAEASSA